MKPRTIYRLILLLARDASLRSVALVWFVVFCMVGRYGLGHDGTAIETAGAAIDSRGESEDRNVLLILADDLGAHDLGCYGADLIETPNIDRFASHALRFSHAYSPAPVCTPTRASILTGKHPARLKMTIWSEGAIEAPTNRTLRPGFSKPDLDWSEVTLAELFQQAGYTTASVGKWHLGDAGHAPETQGFDINVGGNHWGAPTSFFFPYRGRRPNGEIRYVPHLAMGESNEYLTDRLTSEAIGVIDYAEKRNKPFFVMLNHYAPHTPIECKPQDEDYFLRKRRPEFKHQNCGYAGMIRSLDESIGRLIDHLKERSLFEKTVIVLCSDNGGYIGVDETRQQPVTSNWPLRSGKSSLYEGGLRVPLIIQWPGQTTAGQVTDQSVVLTDLFKTLIRSSNKIDRRLSSPVDGIDLYPLLVGGRTESRERLYFHYPHYYHAPRTTPCSSIRQGPWKLIHYYEDGKSELYQLDQDPAEETDLFETSSALANEMLEHLRSWLREVGAELPQKRDRE